jgi:hypothetical protein
MLDVDVIIFKIDEFHLLIFPLKIMIRKIRFIKEACDRSVVFSGYSGFLHQ